MVFDVFTTTELRIAKKISIWGFLILATVIVLSGLIQVINVYMHNGQDGVVSLIQGKTPAVDTLKKNIDAEIVKNKTNGDVVGESPLTISVPSLSINSKIESPGRASVEVLDTALSRGPVYYDGSGYPGKRNMLIFGHSTGFRIVNNQAYKVFNNIKNGKVGELVYIKSVSGVSTYKITGVKKVSKYDTRIQFDSEKPMLTLATCDSFGKASDRWILEADFVGFEVGR